MPFVTYVAFPGCLPEGDLAEEPTLFATPAEAWRAHLEDLGDDRWVPDDENDPEGPHSMTNLALAMERMEGANQPGSVSSLTVDYYVEYAETEWVMEGNSIIEGE